MKYRLIGLANLLAELATNGPVVNTWITKNYNDNTCTVEILLTEENFDKLFGDDYQEATTSAGHFEAVHWEAGVRFCTYKEKPRND